MQNLSLFRPQIEKRSCLVCHLSYVWTSCHLGRPAALLWLAQGNQLPQAVTQCICHSFHWHSQNHLFCMNGTDQHLANLCTTRMCCKGQVTKYSNSTAVEQNLVSNGSALAWLPLSFQLGRVGLLPPFKTTWIHSVQQSHTICHIGSFLGAHVFRFSGSGSQWVAEVSESVLQWGRAAWGAQVGQIGPCRWQIASLCSALP